MGWVYLIFGFFLVAQSTPRASILKIGSGEKRVKLTTRFRVLQVLNAIRYVAGFALSFHGAKMLGWVNV